MRKGSKNDLLFISFSFVNRGNRLVDDIVYNLVKCICFELGIEKFMFLYKIRYFVIIYCLDKFNGDIRKV